MKRLGSIAAAATALVTAAAFLLSGPGRPAAALGAADGTAPTGSVGGVRSPAAGTLKLLLSATDTGAGLAGAEASLDGGASSFVRLGAGSCPEHPGAGSEPPPGAECPESVSSVPLSLDTRSVADGSHQLLVRVTDGAGNTATLVDEAIVVRNAPRTGAGTTASVAIGIGSEGDSAISDGGVAAGGSPDRGSPQALRTRVCRAPRLRMRLAQRPLWYTRPRHVPVLGFGRRYAFKGRLTCRVAGRRVSAPRGTPVNVFYRVWELTFKRHRGPVKKLRKRPIRVRKGGRLKVRLGGFRSGRTLIFRYRRGNAVARSKPRVAVAPRGRLLPRWRR
jgi:hypothetical protein